ncbi:hypothetical protein VPH35_109982 [Triticum aestivum]
MVSTRKEELVNPTPTVDACQACALLRSGEEKNPNFFEEVATLYGKEHHLIVCFLQRINDLVVSCKLSHKCNGFLQLTRCTGVRSKLTTVDLVNAVATLAFLQSAVADQQPAAEQQ